MADRGDILEGVLGTMAIERDRAEGEASAAARDLTRQVGLGYDPDTFDEAVFLAAVGRFLGAHAAHRALRDACRELNRRRIG